MLWKVKVVESSSSSMGLRRLVATQRISPGETVLEESPVACVPFLSSSLSGLQCSEGPKKYNQHELQIKAAAKLRSFNGDICLLASRLLLSIGNFPVDMDMESEYSKLCCHYECLKDDKYCGMKECAAILQGMLSLTDASMDTSFETCYETIGKLCFNAFTICDEYMVDCGIGLFLKASVTNHSCDPNCAQYFDENGKLTIKVIQEVEAGEEIFISYIDTGKPTWWRRCELMKEYNFLCSCSRCLSFDPLDGYNCPSRMCSGVCYVTDTTSNKLVYTNWLKGSSSDIGASLYSLMDQSTTTTSSIADSNPDTQKTIHTIHTTHTIPPTPTPTPIKDYWHDVLLTPLPAGDVLGKFLQVMMRHSSTTKDLLVTIRETICMKCNTCGEDICTSMQHTTQLIANLLCLLKETRIVRKQEKAFSEMTTHLSVYASLAIHLKNILQTSTSLFPMDSYCTLNVRSKIKGSFEQDAKININTRVDTSNTKLLFQDKFENLYIVNFKSLLNAVQKCYPLRHPRRFVYSV